MAPKNYRPGRTKPPRPSQEPGETDLVIIGAGAAGLMAAVAGVEHGLRCLLLEGRHRPGQKLLLCGNNRCNVTHEATATELLDAYGEPVASFLGPAVEAFPPSALRKWFAEHRLQTTVHADDRVFPASEKADDVVHCFRDALRDLQIPLVLNCPVLGLRRQADQWRVLTTNASFQAARVLIATGGVSYPKTGSVGDGQRFARDLGHKLTPYRPGLAGIELDPRWRPQREAISLPDTEATILSHGREAAQTTGEILLDRTCARGPAMVNASRIIARRQLQDVELRVDLFPGLTEEQLTQRLTGNRNLTTGLSTILPSPFARELARDLPPSTSPRAVARGLKAWRLPVQGIRPLKEAMVTVGGVDLTEVDSRTMQSRLCQGVYFAGEVMDVDGPTGGYNLHAAFSTAWLAVKGIARELGRKALPSRTPSERPRPRQARRARKR